MILVRHSLGKRETTFTPDSYKTGREMKATSLRLVQKDGTTNTKWFHMFSKTYFEDLSAHSGRLDLI